MPIWQMTGQDLKELLGRDATQDVISKKPSLLTGVQALADYLDCSQSTIFMLRRRGVLDDAVVSHIGRRIVFDGEKARTLANEYMTGRATL